MSAHASGVYPPGPADDNGPVFDPRDPHGDGKRRYAWQDDDGDAFAGPVAAPPPSARAPMRRRMVRLQVSFPPTVLDRLQAASERTGVPVNDLIRETVRARFGPA